MKNNVLWWVYMEQFILAVPAFWFLTYLWGNYHRNMGNEEGYGMYSVYITGLILLFVVGITWYLMRKMRHQKYYSFINALPVTKGQQIVILAGTMLFFTLVLTVIGEVQLYYFYHPDFTLGEGVISVLVKLAAVFCVDGMFIWIFSHRVPEFGILLLGGLGLGILYGMLQGICNMLQMIFGVPGNRLSYIIWNLWSVLTVSMGDFNRQEGTWANFDFSELPLSYQKMFEVPVLTWKLKGGCAIIFLTCMLVLSLLFIRGAKRNYQTGDLARQRIHQPFHKMWRVLALCMVCGVFTGTAGSLYLQFNVEQEYKNFQTGAWQYGEVPEDILEDRMEYGTPAIHINIRDFTGKRSCWGEGAEYHGDFWKYHHYVMNSSLFARVFSVSSIFSGVIGGLVFCCQSYREKKRRGAV